MTPPAGEDHREARERIRQQYRHFSLHARGRSPAYERISAALAEDDEIADLLMAVEPSQRQPNLLFASVRWLGARTEAPEAFREFVLGSREVVLAALRTRRTQADEPGRTASLLPALSGLRPPLALLEIGAGAGLCLLLDRYGYDFGGHRLGDPRSPVQLRCTLNGPVPVPAAVPEIAWRVGIDAEPVDVGDDEAVRWLECCIWPDQPERIARLHAAIELARRDPPEVVGGDLVELLGQVAAGAPRDATLVVVHSAALMYLAPERRAAVTDAIRSMDARWVSNELPDVVRGGGPLPSPDGAAAFDLRLDGELIARTHHHGAWIHWLAAG